MLKYNPFKPGLIIHPAMFAGRFEEIEFLENSLLQTKNRNPAHFIIHGERGIGKSSLLMLLYNLAIGKIASLHDQKYKFLVLNLELDPNDQYQDILSKIAREFQRVLDKNQTIRKHLETVWNFITRWEIYGIKYQRDSLPPEILLEELSEKFIAVCNGLDEIIDGIYLFIDEADRPPETSNLGEFIKFFTERLSAKGCGNVGIGIAGVSDLIRKLQKHHESSLRAFHLMELDPLLFDDGKAIVTKGLKEANTINKFETSIQHDALDFIATLSEGYPHLIQQYAYSAFETDTDRFIDKNDVIKGLTKENGALKQLGLRYFENLYSGEIFPDNHKQILQIIASNQNTYTTLNEIIEKSGLNKSAVTNAISTLKKKNLVISPKGQSGEYQIPSVSFSTWIRAFKWTDQNTEPYADSDE